MTPLPAAAALAVALFAGVGLFGGHHADTSARDAGLFGAPLRNAHAEPLYVERTTPGRMRKVRCAGAGPDAPLECFEAAR